MRALVIGRGIQGQRWKKNLEGRYEVEIYGRDYREKLRIGRKYNIIIISVPHHAFKEVSETLRKYGISGERVIVEKPGASSFEDFKDVKENLEYVSGKLEMFLPLYIQYKPYINDGILKTRKITYITKLNLDEILYQDENFIYLKSGRCIDPNVLRDLYFHPASLYSFNSGILSGFILASRTVNGFYKIYEFENPFCGIRMVVGRDREECRTIDKEPIKFDNPMKGHIENEYEELCLDKLPKIIWGELERILSLDNILNSA
ncbi:MAG: hypothetical protein BXU00_00915 [Candidatus Nanoclepta minutus]|uniref:Uncharacterized protein n=1 Tax=Candidatus Nanoclepta minutus TaxID=1940235 RepID=A0A397WQ28_9ARCH|nr:MAG: hypothetical protein BXU00_00915 [Candidatus Nanoclepta minutus]